MERGEPGKRVELTHAMDLAGIQMGERLKNRLMVFGGVAAVLAGAWAITNSYLEFEPLTRDNTIVLEGVARDFHYSHPSKESPQFTLRLDGYKWQFRFLDHGNIVRKSGFDVNSIADMPIAITVTRREMERPLVPIADSIPTATIKALDVGGKTVRSFTEAAEHADDEHFYHLIFVVIVDLAAFAAVVFSRKIVKAFDEDDAKQGTA